MFSDAPAFLMPLIPCGTATSESDLVLDLKIEARYCAQLLGRQMLWRQKSCHQGNDCQAANGAPRDQFGKICPHLFILRIVKFGFTHGGTGPCTEKNGFRAALYQTNDADQWHVEIGWNPSKTRRDYGLPAV